MSNRYPSSDTSFNPRAWTDISPVLRQCTIGSCKQPIVVKHCQLLRSYGGCLGADDITLETTEYLAKGFDDLVILLTGDENTVPFKEILSEAYWTALSRLDQSLRFAFQGQRNIDNTIVLDSGMFVGAFHIYAEILRCLHPKVVIRCPIRNDGGWLGPFRSFVMEKGHTAVMTLSDGYNCIKVPSFHPMCLAGLDLRAEGHEPVQKIAREYLFDFTFIVAANALVGRQVIAEATWDLMHHAEGELEIPATGISFRRGIPLPMLEYMNSLNGTVQARMRQHLVDLLLCYRMDWMGPGGGIGHQSETAVSKQDILEEFREQGIVLITESGLLRLTGYAA